MIAKKIPSSNILPCPDTQLPHVVLFIKCSGGGLTVHMAH